MRELTTEEHKQFNEIFENLGASLDVPESCLLYTSDAADE